jgi:TonB family protein
MGIFFAYSIQSALCLALFYLFYKVLLSRETFHRFNRGALLGILALASLIPIALAYVSFHELFATKSSGGILPEDLDFVAEVFPSDVIVSDGNQSENAGILSILLWIYLAGCIACLFFMIVSSFRIIRIIRKGERVAIQKGVRLILSDHRQASFSWMSFAVISRHDYDEVGEMILAHEMAHIRLHHSFDLLIAQICIVTQWFNPAAWLLYQELHYIHEYEADEAVIRQGVDSRQYQLLLIKKAVGARLYSMANSFNHSNLKKRITMMLQEKSKSWARLKYAYVLPLAAMTLVVFAHPKVSRQFEEISTAKVNHFVLETNLDEMAFLPETNVLTFDDDSIFDQAEVMAEFPGGQEALLKYISEHLQYPKEAAEKKIQGRVSCTFVVEKDGSVSNIKVVQSVDPLLDKEAIRVLSEFPKFKPAENGGKPVRVIYGVPIRFHLSKVSAAKMAASDSDKPVYAIVKGSSDSLFVTVEDMPKYVDGEEQLIKDIQANLQYPKEAVEKGIQGRVSCTFVVEKDGSVSNVEVKRSVDPLLDKEAVRALQSLPQKFEPGRQGGQPVRVIYNMPVRFRLPKEKSTETKTQ